MVKKKDFVDSAAKIKHRFFVHKFFLYNLLFCFLIMFEMFEIIGWIFIMWAVSYVISLILMRIIKKNMGPTEFIINILAFIGVLIHELCHFISAKILGAPTEQISVKYRSRYGDHAGPHGHVRFSYPQRMTFMEGVLTAFAPLYVSTWLVFRCLEVLLTSTDAMIFFVFFFLIISLIIGAAPSYADVKFAQQRFEDNPGYATYQIVLIFISGLICWMLIVSFKVTLVVDLIYYVFVILGYFILKYGFKALEKIFIFTKTSREREFSYTNLIEPEPRSYKLKEIEMDDDIW